MKSRAFTLIELLAIIAILGIIAVITIPIITNVVDDAEESAFKESVEGLTRMVDSDYSEFARSNAVTYRFKGENFVCVSCNNGADLELKYTGEIDGGQGTIVSNNGNLTVDIYNDYYSASLDSKGKVVVTKLSDVSDLTDENLIFNGYGNQNSNINFSGLNWDSSNKNFYASTSAYTNIFSGGLIPVDTSKKYVQSVEVKSNNQNATYFMGLVQYDVDKLEITQFMVGYVPNTLTTLAKDLNKGDKVVYLTSTANFDTTGSNTYRKGLIFWNYKDSTGKAYPALTYSRNAYLSIYEPGNINKINNTITLTNAWAGGTIKAGTQLSQNQPVGGTYNYGVLNNSKIPNTWTKYSNIITGEKVATTNDAQRFRDGTKYVKFVALNNYSSQPNSTFYIKNMVFKETK